jgi:SAM-dependent methyltransferase
MSNFKDLLNGITLGLKPAWTRINENALCIQTTSEGAGILGKKNLGRSWWRGEYCEDARHDDNFQYATLDYWNLYRVARILNPGPEEVFYDIGSGMGRMLCIMARRRIRRCVGIELFEPLCNIARLNAERLRGRRSPIEIICGDATTADLSDGTIYYMFNPFGEETMRDTLENLRASLSKKPRTIKIVYCNPTCKSLFQRTSWLQKVRELSLFGGHEVILWQSVPPRELASVSAMQIGKPLINDMAAQG